MTQSIALVGSDDRQVEQLLRSRGLTVVSWMEQDLASKALQASVTATYVMLDVRNEARIPSSLETFCRQHPEVPVLLLVSSLDPALMLDAMRAGVKECLLYPFSVEELDAALSRLAALREPGLAATYSPSLGPRAALARRRPRSTWPPIWPSCAPAPYCS